MTGEDRDETTDADAATGHDEAGRDVAGGDETTGGDGGGRRAVDGRNAPGGDGGDATESDATSGDGATADVVADADTTEARGRDDRAEPVASVAGIGHRFGGVEVLDDVSFDVRPGRAVAVIGPNGAGKTTLFRIVAGLLRPDAGRVRVAHGGRSAAGRAGTSTVGDGDGRDDRGGASGARAVGYLPQNPSFRPTFTVEETLGFYADLVPGPVDVEAALDRVGLIGVRDRRVGALSGGMVRLLGVAQAVLGDPPLVVLDEPTGDLDPAMTDHVFGAVEGLAGGGTAVLYATHDLTGTEVADDLVFLDRGRLVFAGPPSEFVASAGASSLRGAFLGQVREGGETGPTVRRGVDR